MRSVLVLLILFSLRSALAGNLPTASSAELHVGWLKMYNLQFDQAHRTFDEWKRNHPENPMGPASDAAGYLFAEFARLGVLESELFVDDHNWYHRKRLQPDASTKARFLGEVDRVDKLVDAALVKNPQDPDALLAKCVALGLRADYFGLIEKQSLTPLRLTKESRGYAERLLQVNPQEGDAHLAPGVENYLLSQKSAPVRLVLSWTGSQVDHDTGIQQLKLASQHGYYLEPFAKLLLAVAALRDKDVTQAKTLLQQLHERFPENPLFVRELGRIDSYAPRR